MPSYANYCHDQAADCARRARLASSPEMIAYCRTLGLRRLKLARWAQKAGGGPRERSSGYVVTAARQARRYIPGGIWETSRRVDRTGRALVEPAKATASTMAVCICRAVASRPMSAQPAGAASMSPYSINDPKHWLDRAKEARALAEQIDDPQAKRIMRKNADDYERLAKRAEERAAGRWPQSN